MDCRDGGWEPHPAAALAFGEGQGKGGDEACFGAVSPHDRPQGPLSIPARFREDLTERGIDTLVLTEGDHRIVAYPLDEWERFEEKLRQQPQQSPEMRDFLRVGRDAKDCPVDKADGPHPARAARVRRAPQGRRPRRLA
jgi:hypothetical protein